MKEEKILGIEKNVFFMGIASLLTDTASDMIYPLLPIFLTSVLGASFAFVGAVEGIAESTASILKTFSGWLSDKINIRKPIVVSGYTLSNVIKPLIAFTSHPWQVLIIRFADRFGKGVRTSPRDAMIADCSGEDEVGRSFGFHRAMDTLGAVLGPAAAFLLLPIFLGDYRKLFLASAIPAILSVLVIFFFVYEKKREIIPSQKPIELKIRNLDKRFLFFVFIMILFSLGNSSDAFLILRAKGLGVPVVLIPILWMMFNVVYTAISAPAGILSDRIGRRQILVSGLLIYSLTYFGFALAKNSIEVWLLFALYGIYYALVEGIARAYVADLIPSEIRATAYGIYHTSIGLALLPASIIMGFLWQVLGPAVAFAFGATLALISAVLLSFLK